MISFNQLGNHGHLGNQMFQYAAIKGLAAKHKRSFLIPPKEVFGKYYYTKLRSNIDDCFMINSERGVTSFPTINEESFSFDHNLFENLPDTDVNLLGYFQSDKWFDHIKDEIKIDFTFIPEYFDLASELKENFGKDLACLHIRRTDYVNNPNHNCQTIEYYQNFLNAVPDTSQVLIFSDDPVWCKQQELFSSDRFLVSETNNPYIDLCLITMCDYICMASSTFSWWGAYLSNATKIFSPKQWFGPNNSSLKTDDLYCKDWIVI
jgi:hypothetical protein